MSTFSYEVDGSYLDINSRVVEHMGMINAGNVSDKTNKDLVKKYQEIDRTLDEKTVIKGMSELLSSAINSVSQSNQSDIGAMISYSNEMVFKNIDTAGAFNVSNLGNDTTINQNVSAQIKQKSESKVINSISKNIKKQIATALAQIKKDTEKSTTKDQKATNVGDVVGQDVAGKFFDSAKDILSINAGNTNKDSNLKSDEESLKTKYKLDKSFTIDKSDKVQNAIQNLLKKENIAKAVAKTKTSSVFKVSNVKSGSFNADNIKNRGNITQVLNAVFDQSALDSISTVMVTQYANLVNSMIKSADLKAKESKSTSTSGDIYAVGVAGKKLLVAGGKFAKDAGTGLATAAKGYGEGISSALGGFMKPLIIIAIIGAVAGIIMLIIKMSGKSKDSGDGDD